MEDVESIVVLTGFMGWIIHWCALHAKEGTVRKLTSFIFTSVDGFYEGTNGEIEWSIVDEEFRQFAIHQLDDADVLCFGRATYELMAGFWPTEQALEGDPEISSRMNSKPKYVFSGSLEHAEWSATSVVGGDAVEEMRAFKSESGGELLIIGSAHLTGSFVTAGVLDELRIMLFPIVLGQGRSLFEALSRPAALRLTNVRQFQSGAVLLTYELASSAR